MNKIRKLVFFAAILLVLIIANQSDFVFGQVEDEINSEIKDLNSGIDDKKDKIEEIKNQQAKYSVAIKKMQAERASLNNHLAILDNRMAKAELDIEITETEIEQTKLEIQKTDIQIEDKNAAIEKEKKHMADVLRLLYKKDTATPLEIMLINDSLSDFLSEVKYLEDVNEDLEKGVSVLEDLKSQLEREKKSLDEQKLELDGLKEELVKAKEKLTSEIESKAYVLSQVKSSEKQYERLLEQAREEQQAVSAEIASLEKQVRAKITQLDGKKLEFNDNGLIWPIAKNIITAYFHDPDYPFRHIFEHPGIDVRAGQGSALKAAASGYVARAVTGGANGYGYIMIVHGDGLSTVYGHVSRIYVSEDDYVVQGQNIGLSGGLPGTPGAGRLTTGPHLHFEVRLNGVPVDPLKYLP